VPHSPRASLAFSGTVCSEWDLSVHHAALSICCQNGFKATVCQDGSVKTFVQGAGPVLKTKPIRVSSCLLFTGLHHDVLMALQELCQGGSESGSALQATARKRRRSISVDTEPDEFESGDRGSSESVGRPLKRTKAHSNLESMQLELQLELSGS
jgi:hypothetical protein